MFRAIRPLRRLAGFTSLAVVAFVLALGLLLPAGAQASTIVAVANTTITTGSTWTGGSAPVSGDANLWQTAGSGNGATVYWPISSDGSFVYYFYGQTLEIVNNGTLNHNKALTTQYHINNVTLDAGGKLIHSGNSAWNLAFDADGSVHTLQLNGGTISLANSSPSDYFSNVKLAGSGTVTITRYAASTGVIDFSATTVDTHLFTGIFSVTGGGQTGVTKFHLPAITDANESFELDIADASSQLQNDQNIAVKALKLWNTTSSSLATIAPGSYTASGLGGSYAGCFTLSSDSTHTIQVGHSLTYNANGGTGAPAGGWYNTAVTLDSGAGMTYASHAFAGWNTAANGSGTAYAGGASLTLAANTTLYAQWTLLSGTITATANFPAAISTIAGTASSPTSVTVTGSGLSASITATAPTGLEVSSDNITYGSTATLSSTGGTLYARLSASASAGTYNSLNVVLSSTGANPVSVATTSSGNVVAASPYWTATSSGNWGTAGNWFAGTIASGSGVPADFSQVDLTSDTTVHLDSSYTVGSLIFGNTDVTPAANWVVDNNGNSANTLTLAGGTPTVTVNNLGTGKSATIAAEIDGTAGLTKAGSGTLTLSSANNAYSGGTTISAGTLALSGSGTLGSPAGALTLSGGTLDLGAGTPTVGAVSLTGAGTIQNGTLTGSSYAASLTSGTATISAALVSSGGVIMSGAGGTLALSGTGNSISGQVGSTGLGIEATAGTLTISGGSTTVNTYGLGSYSGNNGIFNQTGGTVTLGGDLIVGWNSGPTFTLSGGSLTATGNIRHQDGGTGTLTIGGTATATAATVYDNTGGAVTDSLTVNLNTGGTMVANRLYVNATGSGGSHALNVNFSGGTLKLNNASGNLIDLPTGANAANASVNVTVKSGGATIDTGVLNGTVRVPLLHDSTLGATADGGLTKLGSGTLTLTSVNNTYTGNTTINAGELLGVVGGSSASSAVTVSPASGTSALGVSVTDNTKQWTCASLTTSGAGAPVLDFNFGATTPSGSLAPLAVTGAATFTTQPTVTVDFSGGPALGTYPLMTMASYAGTVPTAVTIPGIAGNYHLTLTGTGPYTLNLVITGIATSPFKWAASGAGTWDFTSLNWKDSSTPTPGTYAYVDGMAAVLDDTYLSANTTVTLNTTVNPGSVTANNSTYNYTITGTGAIAGSTGLTKNGTGTMTLGTANSYTGGTTVSAGTLAVSGSGTLGAATGALNLSGGTLDLGALATPQVGAVSLTAAAASGNTIQNGSLTGSSYVASVASGNAIVSAALLDNGGTAFTMNGSGTVTLSGANTYTGATLVNSGTLDLTGNRTAAAGAITIKNNATLGIGGGSFSLGANSLVINTITGTTGTVNQTGGSISFTGGNELLVGAGSSSGIYNLSGGTLTTVGFNSITNRGVILGVGNNASGTFNLSGTGTLDMSATDSTLEIGRSDLDPLSASVINSTGVFNQTGGSATVYRLGMGGAVGTQSGTTSELNLSGGTFSASVFSYLSFGNSSTSSISISGTADVTLPAFPNALGTSSTATITFNGGTLRPGAASANYLGSVTGVDIMAGGATLAVGSGNDITITQNLLTDGVSTGGGLTKTGPGALTLSGINTYSGATAINAGELIGNTAGSCANSAVTVASGATNGVQLATANGQWTCGGLTYSAGTTYADFDFTATAPSTTVAPLKMSGNLTVNSTVNVIVRSGSSLTAGTSYPLINWTGIGPANLNGFGTVTLPAAMPGTLQLSSSTISVMAGIKVPNLAYTNAPGISRKIAIADLTSAGLASSQGSPTYTITLPSGTSAGGGSVTTDGSRMFYTPSGSPSSDSFSYTVSDGVASATATVTIIFVSVAGAQIDPALIGNDGADHARFTFYGIPNTTYHVQRATALSPTPNWANADSGVIAGANGSYLWTDTQTITSLGGSVYYRISYP